MADFDRNSSRSATWHQQAPYPSPVPLAPPHPDPPSTQSRRQSGQEAQGNRSTYFGVAMAKAWRKDFQETSRYISGFCKQCIPTATWFSCFSISQTTQAAGFTCQPSHHHQGCHTGPNPRHTTAGKTRVYQVGREWDDRQGGQRGEGVCGHGQKHL